jgi:hypothetical protein
MRRPDDFQPAIFGLAGIEAPEHGHSFLGAGDVVRARENIIDAIAPRAIGGERMAVSVEFKAPCVHESEAVGFHASHARIGHPNPAAQHAPNAKRGFNMAVNVDRLHHVDHAIRAAPQGVQQMVGILGAKAAEQHFASIGIDARVPIAVVQPEQLGAVGHEATVTIRENGSGNVQAFCEHGDLLRDPIAIDILKHHDLIVGNFAGFDVGIQRTAHHPESSALVPVHVNGIAHGRVRREQVDCKAFGNDKVSLLFCRVRIGDRVGIGRTHHGGRGHGDKQGKPRAHTADTREGAILLAIAYGVLWCVRQTGGGCFFHGLAGKNGKGEGLHGRVTA